MKRYTSLYFYLLSLIFLISSCSKELSIESADSLVAAQGSLRDTLDNCLPDSVHGTFYNGVIPGGDTAYVEIQVDVQTAGNYNIQTDLQNGFMFADSGFFTSTGINTIKLKPIGTPILIQPTVFTVSFDSSTCNFTVNVNDSTGTGLGNNGGGTDTTNLSDSAWKFTVNTTTYNGPIDTAYVLDTLGAKYLTIIGPTITTGDTAILIGLLLPSSGITPGVYTTATTAQVYFSAYLRPPVDSTVIIYQADLTTSGLGFVTVNIVSYDSATGIVTGTFSGTAKDQSGNAVTISNGSFKAKVT